MSHHCDWSPNDFFFLHILPPAEIPHGEQPPSSGAVPESCGSEEGGRDTHLTERNQVP